MCGISGFYGPADRALLEAMTAVIEHRGPDDHGFYESREVSLGHRRLSIIDLDHGHQPMVNMAGDLQMVYNGELYNFRELRAELEDAGRRFVTESDTEVFLAAYEQWGTECFARFNGMWAVAILDARSAGEGRAARLLLCRDHFGIKPLYLAETPDRLLFASEIKALLVDGGVEPRVDTQRMTEYLWRALHDHDERTFFEGVRQVSPASFVVVEGGERRSETYWEPKLSSRRESSSPARFRAAFKAAVERRLVADVAVGTCLSGGLDSSSIVCMMTELLREHVPDATSMGERLKTFSAVFDGEPIDEQPYIEEVLRLSGAEKHYVRPFSSEMLDDLPAFVWTQDEPIVSSGPYAQYRVMGLAKGRVKVLLDGQAGDELLAGYVPYQYVYLRQLLAERRLRTFVHEAAAARDLLMPLVRRTLTDRRKGLVDQGALLDPSIAGASSRACVAAVDRRSRDDLKLRLSQDLTAYSLPCMLRYEDRNSMAHSIESRLPFLDQELVELALSLPVEAIVRDGWSRVVLREALAGTLPEMVRLRRKKIGFTTPEMPWLRAERATLQGILRSPSFASRPWWNGPAIADAFAACCDGELEESSLFWRVLDVEAWMRVFHGEDRLSVGGRAPQSTLQAAGDAEAVRLAGTKSSRLLLEMADPNPGRHVFMAGPDGKSIYGRMPVRAPVVIGGDDIELLVADALAVAADGSLGIEPGDIVALSEKTVAVSQRRSFPVASIKAGPLAKVVSHFVRKSPAGIGLGIPETMQLAIDTVGPGRIVLAAGAGALARVFGRKGTFYRIAGASVSSIDGPTVGTLPPYDTHAKLPPLDPDGVASMLSQRFSKQAGGTVGVAVVDANDRGVAVLGSSAGLDTELVRWLFADNPLGQGSEQTPFALIRRVDAGA